MTTCPHGLLDFAISQFLPEGMLQQMVLWVTKSMLQIEVLNRGCFSCVSNRIVCVGLSPWSAQFLALGTERGRAWSWYHCNMSCYFMLQLSCSFLLFLGRGGGRGPFHIPNRDFFSFYQDFHICLGHLDDPCTEWPEVMATWHLIS